MPSGLFATPTPTPYGIPQSDGSGFVSPEWLLTNGTGSLHNDGVGNLSWSTTPTTFSGTVALAKLTLTGANGSLTVLNGLVTAYASPT